jgi:hypothetical protein
VIEFFFFFFFFYSLVALSGVDDSHSLPNTTRRAGIGVWDVGFSGCISIFWQKAVFWIPIMRSESKFPNHSREGRGAFIDPRGPQLTEQRGAPDRYQHYCRKGHKRRNPHVIVT